MHDLTRAAFPALVSAAIAGGIRPTVVVTEPGDYPSTPLFFGDFDGTAVFGVRGDTERSSRNDDIDAIAAEASATAVLSAVSVAMTNYVASGGSDDSANVLIEGPDGFVTSFDVTGDDVVEAAIPPVLGGRYTVTVRAPRGLIFVPLVGNSPVFGELDWDICFDFAFGPPLILVQPDAVTLVDEGDTASLAVAAATAWPASFQWSADGQTLSDGGRFSGAQTDTLTISGVAATPRRTAASSTRPTPR